MRWITAFLPAGMPWIVRIPPSHWLTEAIGSASEPASLVTREARGDMGLRTQRCFCLTGRADAGGLDVVECTHSATSRLTSKVSGRRSRPLERPVGQQGRRAAGEALQRHAGELAVGIASENCLRFAAIHEPPPQSAGTPALPTRSPVRPSRARDSEGP